MTPKNEPVGEPSPAPLCAAPNNARGHGIPSSQPGRRRPMIGGLIIRILTGVKFVFRKTGGSFNPCDLEIESTPPFFLIHRFFVCCGKIRRACFYYTLNMHEVH